MRVVMLADSRAQKLAVYRNAAEPVKAKPAVARTRWAA